MTAAPPAMPDQVAMWPAWRPMTSTTITRWWDSAVVCSRSMASTAICTAVSKPKVSSVPERSLSMVLGTPDDLHAELVQLVGHPEGVLAADGDQGVDAEPVEARPARVHATVELERIGARRAEDRAAPWERPAQGLDVERSRRPLDHALPPVEEADQLVAVGALALAHHCSHHRVQTGAVTAAGQHRHTHRAPRGTSSGGSAPPYFRPPASPGPLLGTAGARVRRLTRPWPS